MRYHAVLPTPDRSARTRGALLSSLRAVARTAVLYWCVLSLTFALLRVAPGDPATFLLPPGATATDAARMRAELQLDRPVAVQYARWVRGVLHADFGASFTDSRPVTRVIGDALPVSLGLGLASLLLSFMVGTLVGLVQAARRGSLADLALTTIAVVLAASPAYWLALGGIALFTYVASSLSLPLWLRLPAVGMSTPGVGLHGPRRYVRTNALDIIGADWVRTARAKGLGERRVLTHHVGANLRAPLLTLFALALPGTVAGSVFIETIFGWPGMGRLMVSAIVARDYPVVLGCAAAYAAVVIVANLVAESLLGWADPRIAERARS